jgi:hypothetical protein
MLYDTENFYMTNTSRHRQRIYVSEAELPDYGITYKHAYLKQLMQSGKFPVAILVCDRRWAWPIEQIETYLASRPLVTFDQPKAKK